MKSGAISDSQISASSRRNVVNQAAIHGGLNFEETSLKAGAWVAATNDVNQWLQVDLGNQITNVSRVQPKDDIITASGSGDLTASG